MVDAGDALGRRRRLGRTGFEVRPLGLGAFQLTAEHFGVPEEEALRIFDLAASEGIDYVDTAPGYGSSEVLVGKGLAQRPDWHPRVSTKVGYLPNEDDHRDRVAIRRSVEASRRRLGLERIDMLMIHEPEFANWWGLSPDGRGPVMDALLELRKEGVISYIGLGGCNDFDVLAGLIEGGLIDVALVAGGFTLLDQPIRDAILPAAARSDAGIVVGGAFAQGAASGLLAIDREPIQQMLRTGDFTSPHFMARFDRRTCERLLNLYDLAEDLGIPMTELTIRYVLSETGIHTHIPGAREAAHLRSNLEAIRKGPFDPAVLTRIEEA